MEQKEIRAIYDKVYEIAQKLQSHYFENERFYDRINGAESMDNVTGWMYDIEGVVDGYYKGDKALEELKWAHDAFEGIAYIMECKGAGMNGDANGICNNLQYPWAMSKYAASLIKGMAEKLGFKLTPMITLMSYR